MSTPASSTPSSTRRERPRQTSLKQQQRRWGPHAMGEVAEVACPARFVHLRIVLQSSGPMNPGTTRRTSCRQEFSTAHSVRSTSPSNNCSTARLASNPSLHELPKKPASIPQTALRHTPLTSRAAAPTAASSRTSQSCRPACANIAQPADRVSVLRSERKRTHWWHLRHAVGGRRAITPTLTLILPPAAPWRRAPWATCTNEPRLTQVQKEETQRPWLTVTHARPGGGARARAER
jgi:hypothetical protein